LRSAVIGAVATAVAPAAAAAAAVAAAVMAAETAKSSWHLLHSWRARNPGHHTTEGSVTGVAKGTETASLAQSTAEKWGCCFGTSGSSLASTCSHKGS